MEEKKQNEASKTLNGIFLKLSKLPEKKLKLYQIAFGLFLGVLCGLLVFLFSKNETLSMPLTFAALGIALFVPGQIEKRLQKRLMPMRASMAAGVVIAFLSLWGLGIIVL